MNNCYQSCNAFFNNKTKENLGDIMKDGSCANCLYWQWGPGRPSFYANTSTCACNQKFQSLSNFGKTFDVNGFNEVQKCLDNNKGTCDYLPNTFNNIKATCPIVPGQTQMKPCDPSVVWNQRFNYTGIM